MRYSWPDDDGIIQIKSFWLFPSVALDERMGRPQLRSGLALRMVMSSLTASLRLTDEEAKALRVEVTCW